MAEYEKKPVPAQALMANLGRVRARMAAAAVRAGRSDADIRLVAVTKYVGLDEIRTLLKAGVRDLGENRIQAAHPKITALQQEGIAVGARWRMIGHLQTNKARQALQDFSTIDAVDSVRLLECLAKEAGRLGRQAVPCLAEVNVSGEEQKHGLPPEQLQGFLERARQLPELDVQGLMTMAPLAGDPECSRPFFAGLRALRDQANQKGWYRGLLQELSMGMSQDFEIAVEEGATLLRVGSALYEDPMVTV